MLYFKWSIVIGFVYLLVLSGCQRRDEAIPEGTIPDIAGTLRSRKATKLRVTSVFQQGWITILNVSST